ncbi:MAG: polyprenyl synthetase family protein [Marmoricola sp.]
MTESQEVAVPAAPSAWDPSAFRDGIESTLQTFVDGQAAWLAPLGEDAQRLVEHARISISGGKRFRASFCWWGHLAVNDAEDPGFDPAALLRACASLELLHASALVHDDYMDASDVRRGRPSTHRAFEALHLENGWSASAAQYGASAAILLGDLLLSWADELLRTCGLPAQRVLDALGYFDLTRTEVVTGQFLDVSAQARATSEVELAMRVVRYKSAKYSIERPLHIGAALAGGTPAALDQLSAFGLPLGEAFQLRDDLLGVFGDPEVTGKPAGDDLVEGKRTVLVALALQSLAPAERDQLDHALGKPLTEDEVADLRALISASGAQDQVEQLITTLTSQALTALEQAGIREGARAVLRELAAAATQRTV